MALSAAQRRALKGKAHHLNVVIQTGDKGLTDAVFEEAEMALTHHELIKAKLVSDPDERKATATDFAQRLNAEVVQTIGHVVVLYRLNPSKGRYRDLLREA